MFVEIPNGDVSLKSVLVLEDEALVSMMVEDIVRDLGVETVHVLADVAAAKSLLEAVEVDCAILDVRVRDGDCSQIADMLLLRGTPLVFSTGSGADSLPMRHRHLPRISKPFADDDLGLLVLDAVAAARAARTEASMPGEPTRVASIWPTD
jgi:CheY-like chemotaxis protein